MILTRSPHYINVPIAYPTTTSGVTMSLYIWSGLKASVPVTANYTLTKKVPTITTTELNIDISNKINDYLEPDLKSKATTGVELGGDTALWVYYSIVYNDDVETITDLTNTILSTDGYGYHSDGANPTYPGTNYLLDGDYFQMSRVGVFMIPFLIVQTPISITPLGGSATNYTLVTSTDSSDTVGYLFIHGSDFTEESITVNLGLESILIDIVDEYKYEPNDICFINKYGFQQVTPFFKDKKDTLKTSEKKYKNKSISNANYSVSEHQKRVYNKTGSKTFEMISGYYEEENNEHFTQLMLSESVWLLKDLVFTPVNVVNKSLVYKTQLREKLIGYKINFEYAFDEINSI